jgi:hypothetical protein
LLIRRSIGATSGSASRAATWSRPARRREVGREHLDDDARLPLVGRRRVQPLPVAGDQHEIVAVTGEAGGELATDAGRRSRDHRGGHTATLVP